MGEGRDDHLLTYVLRFLNTLHRVIRHGSLAISVPQDGLENTEYVHLVSMTGPVSLQLVQEAFDHDRRDRVELSRSERGNDVNIDGNVHFLARGVLGHPTLPGPPLLRAFRDGLLTEFAAGSATDGAVLFFSA
ncbi:hypothetical protein ABZ892_11740 [Streptomyces sp. NPDC046924]|uniref:hypothetical protein n=1 Tax=Streptomyces sp. NPDC046924 TaxID=3155136 RepID=UPI0033F918DB